MHTFASVILLEHSLLIKKQYSTFCGVSFPTPDPCFFTSDLSN